ncbi:MAG: tRNA (N(6)-L-threonylcarbamoyladenosine(37)-C(2))-methylthiotransferase MtaB [Christensenella sp.]|uniref:tRNA (N(6)-L-threonylcarbamoyladenosine(37)-C(2))- methylthiotransferase MtaB n=1 Tax=Christensenella sp. TaxID=1935934 RepID=UPI002B1EF9DD|nr:tRNA (N(6)-L-threonylcarbamoyladenosine(37)-C(2))-methylthiotransferase MtaB [Christensenella sp.]MEA5003132.1 tRNA (N(6)-L-threonylcarbamoyladenosine(37)-C(2))-methylthiotransferase MtaB [Christensenella sp.]
MRVAAYTLGCKVNQYDTNAMMELLLDAGFEQVSFEEEADVYLINTCTVTNMADKKSRNMIRRIHSKHPRAVICVCGCLSQRDSEGIAAMEGVSAVVGTEDRKNIVAVIDACLSGGGKACGVREIDSGEAFEELSVRTSGELERGYIKIQEGCNNFCSYCIIPYVRGRVRSRARKSIVQEACALVKAGVKEIVLTGIHISSYGQENGESLIGMLRDLNGVEGIGRIRLGSLEPHILEKPFLEELHGLEKICPHFHVSLQSGCDSVLARMNRKYSAEQFAQYIENIREIYQNPAVTTDVITGFPGETEEDFEETLQFVERIGFSRIHVFPYSEREGTPAAGMDGSVPMQLRRERANRLIDLAKGMEKEYTAQFLGTVQEVLLEQNVDGCAEGYTDRYLRVRAQGVPGTLEKVLLSRYEDGILYGERRGSK